MIKQTYLISYNVHHKNPTMCGVPGFVERKIIHITLDKPEDDPLWNAVPILHKTLHELHEKAEQFEGVTLNTVQEIHVIPS